jgi:hypothetical protein
MIIFPSVSKAFRLDPRHTRHTPNIYRPGKGMHPFPTDPLLHMHSFAWPFRSIPS